MANVVLLLLALSVRIVDGRGMAPGWDAAAAENARMTATQDAMRQCGSGTRVTLVEPWQIGRDTSVVRYTYALGRFRCEDGEDDVTAEASPE